MIITCESLPNLRTTTIVIVARHGASHDVVAGLTSVLMGSIQRGTSNFSETEIARMIDGKGSELFSIVEKDFSALGIRTVPKDAEAATSLLVEIVLESYSD